jgi:hypothetical protein
MLDVFLFQCTSLICDIPGLFHSAKNVGIFPEGSMAPGRMIDTLDAGTLHEFEASITTVVVRSRIEDKFTDGRDELTGCGGASGNGGENVLNLNVSHVSLVK